MRSISPRTESRGDLPVPGQARHRWWPLAVIASAHLMVILDTTVMFVALPSTQRALHLSVTDRQWVLTAYMLSFGGLLLLGGRLADRLGSRRTLMVGVIGFAIASAVGGASVDALMLICARVIQGGFGAVLVSSTKSLLAHVYTEERERAMAMGIFAVTLTAGLAIGLVVGGVLTTGLSWRWCLYVNVPVSAFVVIGALRVLPTTPGRREVGIDAVSAFLACAGTVGLVYGLGEGPSLGWASGAVLSALAVAAVMLSLFVIRQARWPNPLLPLQVVRERNRGGAFMALVFNSLSTFGMMLILTYQLQTVLAYSALKTGLMLIPFAVAAGTASATIAPRLIVRVPPRYLITAGTVLSGAGLIPLVGLTPAASCLPLVFLAQVLEGLGTGLTGPVALTTSLRRVEPADLGAASAASSAASQVGSSIGTALLNTIAVSATAAYLEVHVGVATTTATVHGYTIAMAWGAAILLVVAIPIGVLINARAASARAA